MNPSAVLNFTNPHPYRRKEGRKEERKEGRQREGRRGKGVRKGEEEYLGSK